MDGISVCYESANVTHFRVPAGKGGGPMVTVRTSIQSPNYLCLTCIALDCRHAKAAAAYDKTRPHEDEP